MYYIIMTNNVKVKHPNTEVTNNNFISLLQGVWEQAKVYLKKTLDFKVMLEILVSLRLLCASDTQFLGTVYLPILM